MRTIAPPHSTTYPVKPLDQVDLGRALKDAQEAEARSAEVAVRHARRNLEQAEVDLCNALARLARVKGNAR